MRISELSEGPRPHTLHKGMEALIQGFKVVLSIGLVVLVLVGSVVLLQFSDESISGQEAAYKPNPIEPIYELELDENQLLVLRTRRRVLIRDLRSGELLDALPAEAHIVATSKWVPNSQQLILAYADGRIAFMKRDESWRTTFTAQWHREDIRTIAVSNDGRLAATGSPDRLCLWDVDQGKLLAETTQLKCSPDVLQFSPNRNQLLVGTDTGKMFVFQSNSLKLVRSMQVSSGALSAAAYFDHGEKVLVGDLHGWMFVLDPNTGETVWKDQCLHLHMIALAISPDESYAAVSDWTDNIHLISLKTFERIDSFVGHKRAAATMQFSRDGKNLYSSGYDGTVRVWDVETFAELSCYRGTLPEKDE